LILFTELVGEQLLNKLTTFVDEHSRQLHEFEEALDDSLAEVGDLNADPIALNIQPYEQTNVVQLVRTDNKVFNKVIITFAALCVEMQHLKDVVSIVHFDAYCTLYDTGHIKYKTCSLRCNHSQPLFRGAASSTRH
jgi:WASH complex subunit 7